MQSIALKRSDVIIGEAQILLATPGGYADLLDWAASLGRDHLFGVEGRGS